MEISVQPSNTEDLLFQASAIPDEKTIEEYELRDKGLIESILGSTNECWLGKPHVYDLSHLQNNFNDVYSNKSARTRCFLLQFSCSFRPAQDCEFISASIRMIMKGDSFVEKPIVLDLFPREVYIPIRYKKTLKIEPSLKIGLEKTGSAELSVAESKFEREYLNYEPEITGFGKGESEFGWDFNKSRARPIRGIKDLFAIIQFEGDKLSTRFDMYAEIQTKLGPVRLPKFIDYSGEPIISKEYALI